MLGRQANGRNGQRTVDAVRAAVRADDIAVTHWVVVPTTGPRSVAVAAAQWMGSAS